MGSPPPHLITLININQWQTAGQGGLPLQSHWTLPASGEIFGFGAISRLGMFEMVTEESEERKLTLASAETLFSPAQKSVEELKSVMNLEQFRK